MKTGDEYFDSDEFRDMLESYEHAVNSGEPVFMDSEDLSEIADYYHMTGNYDEADAAIELALSLSPGAIAPLTYKIHEALYDGDPDEAERWFEQIINTDAPDYAYDRAEIMIVRGQVDEADSYLREVFKSVPPDEYQDYVIDVAGIFQDYGLNDKAMEWMLRAKQEDTPQFKELMARVLFGLGKYKDSERLFNELIDTNPFSASYWKMLASAQFMNEDYSNAVQSSEYAIAIDPEDPEGIIAKANGLYQLNNFEEALDYYRRYSAIEPDDEFALMHQGTCLINLGRSAEAIDTLRMAKDVSPDDSPYLPNICQELAFAYSESGRPKEALAMLDDMSIMMTDPIQTLIIRGHVLLAAGMISEAEECFKQAIIGSDDPNQTLLRIIVSLYDNKYVETAYLLLERYFKIVGEDNDEGYGYMALFCYDLKKYDEFLVYLKRACDVNPRECQIALSHIFPDNVPPEQYYEYIKDKMTPTP